MKIKYVANDGTEFDDQSLCLAYERLVLASKNEQFDQAVKKLFLDCTSWESGPHIDSDTWPVLRLEKGKPMDTFKANLVRALPELNRLLEQALSTIPVQN